MSEPVYDCIVAGGGHAGCEAALAMAKLGLKVMLVTGNLDRLGYLSCNPAIGGLAKGHLAREIDALGGWMGQWADASGIQFRTLNMSRGAAVRGTRAQMDRLAYSANVKKIIYATSGISLWQDNVTKILEKGGRVCGVLTSLGKVIRCRNLLLATGTFLNGQIFIGMKKIPAGRMGDSPALGLTESLRSYGFTPGRLKTGTTPRILRSSINFDKLVEQKGDNPRPHFSFLPVNSHLPQIPCHITWTNAETHTIIADNLDQSPLYQGVIKGVGARYCPSIEDKIGRFPDRERHQIFLEPEGVDSGEVYCNGISTSLPWEAQEKMIHSIAGLENAVLVRPGYAIEYDFINPLELFSTLETRRLPGLWHAGQINGTSGYEEAAAQGLWAALNIYAKENDLEPFLPDRDQAYMSVLVDDLVTEGTEEPYRMFTSRAEHRLLLREDTADRRLTPLGRKYNLVDDKRWRLFEEKQEKSARLKKEVQSAKVCQEWSGWELCAGQNLAGILLRPDCSLARLLDVSPDILAQTNYALASSLNQCDIEIMQSVESDIKYAGYLEKQKILAKRSKKLETQLLPENFDYGAVAGLSAEGKEKLLRFRPETLGRARRISGITPADVACLEIQLYKLGLINKSH